MLQVRLILPEPPHRRISVTSTNLGTPSASAGCAFVTKFNPSGTAIDFSVCLGNSAVTAFALDKSGNIYLATGRAVVKLDPSAQNILYTTAICGFAESMGVDAVGNVYVAGCVVPPVRGISYCIRSSAACDTPC